LNDLAPESSQRTYLWERKQPNDSTTFNSVTKNAKASDRGMMQVNKGNYENKIIFY
jgi:hypothetical protein